MPDRKKVTGERPLEGEPADVPADRTHVLSAEESALDAVPPPVEDVPVRKFFAGMKGKLPKPKSLATADSFLHQGTVLGRYRLLERIGQGGMGVVFKAEHVKLHREVAIKVLPTILADDPLTVDRFHREVQAAARLSHPNIVVAYDADQSEGVHFLVMEYVVGTDLSRYVLRHGPLSVGLAVECILQTARGLEHAHAQGVVHRDIKPSNLLLREQAEKSTPGADTADSKPLVKILDMGLARIQSSNDANTADSTTQLTRTGSMMGTIDFMAPEQALDSRAADERADIYSLGCTLFYLLTGRHPFTGNTMMKRLLAHREQPIPSLVDASGGRQPVDRSERSEAIGANQRADARRSPLQRILEKMLAKDPKERYQSASEVIAALQAVRTAPNGAVPPADVAKTTRTSVATAGPKQPTLVTPTVMSHIHQRNAADRKRVRVIAASAIAGLLLTVLLIWAFLPPANQPTTDKPKKSVAQKTPPKPTPPQQPSLAKAPFDAVIAKQHQTDWAKSLGVKVEQTNSVGMKFRLIPPGEFLMGSTQKEIDDLIALAKGSSHAKKAMGAESPQHRVRLTKAFYLGIHEVTQSQFRQVMGFNPSAFQSTKNKKLVGRLGTDRYPVESLQWMSMVDFCNKLSKQEGLSTCYSRDGAALFVHEDGTGYRLPTEAEWEFACRAGTQTRYHFGDDAKSIRLYAGPRSPVGSYRPNPFGLFDMYGGVWEICQDLYDPEFYSRSQKSVTVDPYNKSSEINQRSVRGGRSAIRKFQSMIHVTTTGFRVVRNVPKQKALTNFGTKNGQ